MCLGNKSTRRLIPAGSFQGLGTVCYNDKKPGNFSF